MSQTLRGIEARLDAWGQPAWIATMVGGFILFWPVGLAVLGYMIWSGRMGCSGKGRRASWQKRMASRMEGFSSGSAASTNRAFTEYREQTLKRLEEEAREFDEFLEQLRAAKDRQEFEDFMRSRKESDDTAQPPSGARTPDTGAGLGGQTGPLPA